MEKTNKLSVFWKIMFAYMAVWLIVTVAVSGKLWSFCKQYQMDYDAAEYVANPDLIMDKELSAFSSDKIMELVTNQLDDVSEYETTDNIENGVKALVENKQLSYQRTEKFSNRKPTYQVFADGSLIGQVSMKQLPESDSFGFHLCEVIDKTLMWEGFDLIGVDIEVPLGESLIINGKLVDDSFLVESKPQNSVIKKEAFTLTGKQFGTDTYHLDGFISTPEIVFKEAEEFTLDEDMTDLVLKANDAYIKNMNLCASFDSIRIFFETNGNAIANIKSAQSGLAWSGKPDKLEIKSVEITEANKYSEDVIVVTTKSLVYRLYRGVEYNEEMNYEWLYVHQDNGWKIRNFSYAN